MRVVIADCVKAMPDAPRELILQLAHDTALAVCDPVVRLSPLLTDADLLALLATPPHPAVDLRVALPVPLERVLQAALAFLWLQTALVSAAWPRASGVLDLLAARRDRLWLARRAEIARAFAEAVPRP